MTLDYAELQRRHDLLKEQADAYRSVLTDIATMARARGGKESLMSAMAARALNMTPAELRAMHKEISGARLAKVCARFLFKYVSGAPIRGESTALNAAMQRYKATQIDIKEPRE